MKLKHYLIILILSVGSLKAQEYVNGRWQDDNLTIWIEKDEIRAKGELFYCIADTSRGTCIQNLSSGFELKLYDATGKLIYEGFASGRRRGVKLPQAYPQAREVALKAFKPWVINKSNAVKIHQEKAIEVKYKVK